MAKGTDDQPLHHAVDEVWEAIDDLRNSSVDVRTQITKLDTKVSAIQDTLQSLKRDNKPPWGIIVGILAIILPAIAGVFGTALAPLYLSDAYTRNMLERHIELDGHPHAMQQHAAVAQTVQRIDGDLTAINDRIERDQDTLISPMIDRVRELEINTQSKSTAQLEALDYRKILMAFERRISKLEATSPNGREGK
jgi:predicted  nucleic acid-binding Zn-ribbon protein